MLLLLSIHQYHVYNMFQFPRNVPFSTSYFPYHTHIPSHTVLLPIRTIQHTVHAYHTIQCTTERHIILQKYTVACCLLIVHAMPCHAMPCHAMPVPLITHHVSTYRMVPHCIVPIQHIHTVHACHTGSSSSPGAPGVGCLPSLIARRMSLALNLAYFFFSAIYEACANILYAV